jgi:hypothetical protein
MVIWQRDRFGEKEKIGETKGFYTNMKSEAQLELFLQRRLGNGTVIMED